MIRLRPIRTATSEKSAFPSNTSWNERAALLPISLCMAGRRRSRSISMTRVSFCRARLSARLSETVVLPHAAFGEVTARRRQLASFIRRIVRDRSMSYGVASLPPISAAMRPCWILSGVMSTSGKALQSSPFRLRAWLGASGAPSTPIFEASRALRAFSSAASSFSIANLPSCGRQGTTAQIII